MSPIRTNMTVLHKSLRNVSMPKPDAKPDDWPQYYTDCVDTTYVEIAINYNIY